MKHEIMICRGLMVFICFVLFQPSASMAEGNGACPLLPMMKGPFVKVATEKALFKAVNSVSAGTTILIADGTYNLARHGHYLLIKTPGIALRSQSGDRRKVILDDNHKGSEIITIAASDVTIADITIMRAGTHPIHVVSSGNGDTLRTTIYNVHIIDPGQQAIKINPHSARQFFTDSGLVACSTIELTDAGRAKVLEINGSCYTGGIDAHHSKGWVVRDNTIQGFWCERGLSEHGIHFWSGSRATLVERNLLIDNARGIGFGLVEHGKGRTYPDATCRDGGYVDHYEGVIRNNFIFASREALFSSASGVDGGIALAQACNPMVAHNTVAFTKTPFAAIEWRFANTKAVITNNLLTHNLMPRNGASALLTGNLSGQPLSLFVDGSGANLHLSNHAAAAIDKGAPMAPGVCDDDYDMQTRPVSGRDIGADECCNPIFSSPK